MSRIGYAAGATLVIACWCGTVGGVEIKGVFPYRNYASFPALNIRWEMDPGRVYQVQTASQPAGPWKDNGYALFGSGGIQNNFYRIPAKGAPYYRIVRGVAANALDFSQARCVALTNNQVVFENVLHAGQPWQIVYRMGQTFKEEEKIPIATLEIPEGAITIDGNASDWTSIPAVYVDTENDQEPVNGHPGTDIKEVKIARDDESLYMGFFLYDGNPSADGTMYLTELQQYFNQYHAAGDTLVAAAYTGGGWNVTVQHREGLGVPVAQHGADHVGVGAQFIEYKVPIEDLEHDGLGLFRKCGIETRFLRTYVHYVHSAAENDPLNTYDGAGEDVRAMVVRFYE